MSGGSALLGRFFVSSCWRCPVLCCVDEMGCVVSWWSSVVDGDVCGVGGGCDFVTACCDPVFHLDL